MKKLYFAFVLAIISYCGFSQNKPLNRNDITYTYIEALRHKSLGNLPQAAYLFKKLSELDTICASCYYELSKVFLEGSDIKNGLPYAQKAYLLDSKNYWYVQNYANYLRINSEFVAAVPIYSKLASFPEYTVEDKFNYSECLLNTKNAKQGLEIIAQVEKENGFSEQFVLLKYRYYLNHKDFKLALQELDLLLQLNPDNAIYYGMQAEIYALQKKNDLAFQAYRKLIDARPNFASAYNSFGKFYLSLNDTANAYKQFNKVLYDTVFSKTERLNLLGSFLKESDSKNYFDSYLKTYYTSFLEKNDTVLAYREFLCDYYESRNNYQAAALAAYDLISRNSNQGVYWDRYFYYLNILKQYDTILTYENVIQTKLFDRPFVLFVAGLASYLTDKPVRSNYYLKRGLDIGQSNKFLSNQMLNLIAENYYKIHKPDSSFYYYELAISEGNDDIGMLNNYAYYLALEKKDLDKALNMSRLTITKEPKNATYLDTYAWVLFHLKLYNEAYKYILLAYKYDKRGSAEMLEHVGDILFCLGKKSKAIDFWEKAAKISSEKDRILGKISTYVCP